MQYYVYILSNSYKNVIYTGVTNDLVSRVYEHKQHLDKSSFTSRYNVDHLVYFEETTDMSRVKGNLFLENSVPYMQLFQFFDEGGCDCHSELA